MRTTLTIDDDVLAAARGLAARDRKSLGEVISRLSRQALRPRAAKGGSRNGIPLLEVGPEAVPATMELVNRLRDDLP